jgi:hypothetical protein
MIAAQSVQFAARALTIIFMVNAPFGVAEAHEFLSPSASDATDPEHAAVLAARLLL